MVAMGIGRNCRSSCQSNRCKRNAEYRQDLHATPPVNAKGPIRRVDEQPPLSGRYSATAKVTNTPLRQRFGIGFNC